MSEITVNFELRAIDDSRTLCTHKTERPYIGFSGVQPRAVSIHEDRLHVILETEPAVIVFYPRTGNFYLTSNAGYTAYDGEIVWRKESTNG